MNGVGNNVTNIPKGSYALLIEGYSVGESKCGHQVHLGKEKVLPHLPTPSCPTPPPTVQGLTSIICLLIRSNITNCLSDLVLEG